FFCRIANMNGGPTEHTRHNAFFGVNVYAHTRRNLVVAAAVFTQINKPFFSNVMHKPTYFIGVRFNSYFVFSFWINYANYRSVGVNNVFVNVWLYVIKPNFLPTAFKAC